MHYLDLSHVEKGQFKNDIKNFKLFVLLEKQVQKWF